MDLSNLIVNFTAADYTTLVPVMADASRPRAERKIAQAVYFYHLSIISAAMANKKADAMIAEINAWNEGKPLFVTRTRADYRTIRFGRTDIRRLLEDAASEEMQAVEWMERAQSVARDPSILGPSSLAA